MGFNSGFKVLNRNAREGKGQAILVNVVPVAEV